MPPYNFNLNDSAVSRYQGDQTRIFPVPNPNLIPNELINLRSLKRAEVAWPMLLGTLPVTSRRHRRARACTESREQLARMRVIRRIGLREDS